MCSVRSTPYGARGLRIDTRQRSGHGASGSAGWWSASRRPPRPAVDLASVGFRPETPAAGQRALLPPPQLGPERARPVSLAGRPGVTAGGLRSYRSQYVRQIGGPAGLAAAAETWCVSYIDSAQGLAATVRVPAASRRCGNEVGGVARPLAAKTGFLFFLSSALSRSSPIQPPPIGSPTPASSRSSCRREHEPGKKARGGRSCLPPRQDARAHAGSPKRAG